MLVIQQMLIPASNKFTRPGRKRKPQTITIHETGNTSKGANALAHAKLQYRGNSRQASWHYTVDDTNIYRSIPDDENAYAAGDGAGPGNLYSIQIEICTNSDGNFTKAVENAAWLVRQLMVEYGLGLEKVVQHNHWSGKNCPENLRNGKKGINWNGFTSLVRNKPLVAHVPSEKEAVKMYEPSSKAIKDSTAQILAKMEAEQVNPLSKQWREKLQAGTLSESDATGLLYVALDRYVLN